MNCGFSRVQEAAFARQPGLKAAYEQFLAQANRLAGPQRGALGAAPDVTVPVVVHLVFSPVGGNPIGGITDAQVADAQVADAPSPSYSAIVSPALNLSGFQGRPLQLSFRTARANNSTLVYSGNDELLVQYGTDCALSGNVTGQTYFNTQLQAPGQTAQNGFVPTSAQQWATTVLPLNPLYIGASTWVRFQYMTYGGNPFYLDQVRIYEPAATATAAEALARHSIAVYPNPLTAETAVHFTLPAPTTAAVLLTDLLSRTVAQVPAKAHGAGPQAIPLPGSSGPALAAGVYLVRLTLGEENFTTRLVVP